MIFNRRNLIRIAALVSSCFAFSVTVMLAMNRVMNYHLRQRGLTYVFITLAGLLWFGVPSLRATDRYVVVPGTPGGTNAGEYDSWAIAATQIQWAVDKAAVGETVLVSNGTYTLTNQITVTNGITLRSAEGHGLGDTIINGNFVAGSAVTNNRCLWIKSTAAGALVHGFTISNGAIYSSGGGVLMDSGVLSNCHVRNNISFSPDTAAYYGGGIAVNAGTVTVCRVTDNIVTNFTVSGGGSCGGGIYSYGLISDCIISSNYTFGTEGYGGGVSMGSIMRSSLVSHNRAAGGGGGLQLASGSIMINSTSTLNYANRGGGGIYGRGTLVLSNCVISYNQCVDAGSGGMRMRGSPCTMKVYNSTFMGNTNGGVEFFPSSSSDLLILDNCVIEDNAYGGIFGTAAGTNNWVLNSKVLRNRGPGIYFPSPIAFFIRNCLIAKNNDSAGFGAGGLYLGSTSSVSGCTIVSNLTTASGGRGGGIRFGLATPNIISVSSCVIYSNGVGGTSDVYDAASPANINALRYSCVGTNPGFTGAGIIVASPQFKDFAGENYRLAPSSPCVNRGSNEDWMTNAVDLDGKARIRYGTVDMGAYERINEGTIYGFH